MSQQLCRQMNIHWKHRKPKCKPAVTIMNMSLLESMKMQENPVNPLKEELLLIRHASSGKMYLYDVLEIKKVNPNIRKAVRRNGATFCNLRLGCKKL